ncbi:MAG TPA: sigma-70 family RNA polymerase sigma factor [Solirubrobacteraceae bacterium]|nr:sigma-70 family RNA polymerase sigma factor [Solirubrobacteraceae bacterium]
MAIRRRCAVEARRLVRTPEEVDDVLQEAMMRAWKGRATCNSPHAPIPWCLQITRNEAFRRMRRMPFDTALDSTAELSDACASEAIDRIASRVDVDRALDRLSADERMLVALRYSHDYSQPEIARRLDIPEGTAKVRLHRVRKRLETLMETI